MLLSRHPSLIITADDLGYSSSRDDGIFFLFQLGAISRASLLVNGANAGRALAHAHAVGMPVGLHLNLSEGAPLSARPTTLLAPGARCMRGKLGFRTAFAAGEVATADIAREAAAQAAAFASLHPAGALPAHLDGHQHVHVIPGVAAAVAGALRGLVRAVRLPAWAGDAVEPLCGVVGGAEGGAGGLGRAEFYRRVGADAVGAEAAFAEAGFAAGARIFVGFSLSPDSDGTANVGGHARALERVLSAALAAADGAAVELMVHPGWRTPAAAGAPQAPAPAPALLPALPPALEARRADALSAAARDGGTQGGCCECCGADLFSQNAAREVELGALAALAIAAVHTTGRN